MFDEPAESPFEDSDDPKVRAREKADEFRTHAELAAVFEGTRKFEAQLIPGFDPELARETQRTMARLEKSKTPESPILPPASVEQAKELLNLPQTREISTNDYHIHRRPGEVMIFRWLAGAEVQAFYERLQAHFDAALEGFREDERQALEWKQGPQTEAYLAALREVEVKMPDRYLREQIRQFNCFVLSTQSADELNIAYLSDYIMGVSAAQIVGSRSAPGPEPQESDLAWFFKLFSLRGVGSDNVERMCFFAFLQKSQEFDAE
jgi:hypothetical protein